LLKQPEEEQQRVVRWTMFVQQLADVVMSDWTMWLGGPVALAAGREAFKHSFREVMYSLLPPLPPPATPLPSAPPTPPASGGRVAPKPVQVGAASSSAAPAPAPSLAEDEDVDYDSASAPTLALAGVPDLPSLIARLPESIPNLSEFADVPETEEEDGYEDAEPPTGIREDCGAAAFASLSVLAQQLGWMKEHEIRHAKYTLRSRTLSKRVVEHDLHEHAGKKPMTTTHVAGDHFALIVRHLLKYLQKSELLTRCEGTPPKNSREPTRFHSQQFRRFYEAQPSFMSLEESALARALQEWLFFVFNTDKQNKELCPEDEARWKCCPIGWHGFWINDEEMALLTQTVASRYLRDRGNLAAA